MTARRSFWLLATCSACLCAAEAIVAASGSETVQPIELGERRQLLFDDLFLEKSQGITLRVAAPIQEAKPVIVANKPWENEGIGAYHTVMREDGTFRMWYDVLTRDKQDRIRRFLCYAESQDGIHWHKVRLGLIPFGGSRANNIVAPPVPGASQQGGSVFRDDRAPPAQRYKLWTKYEPPHQAETQHTASRGHWAMVSPDGLRWSMIEGGYPPRTRRTWPSGTRTSRNT